MVNIGQKVDRSNGWKSLKHGSRYPKPSKWQSLPCFFTGVVCCEACSEVSQTAVPVLTNRNHILRPWGRMRCHITLKSKPPLGRKHRNGRYGRDRHKDIHLTEGGLGIDSVSMSQEVSRRRSSWRNEQGLPELYPWRSHKPAKDWTLDYVQIRWGAP